MILTTTHITPLQPQMDDAPDFLVEGLGPWKVVFVLQVKGIQQDHGVENQGGLQETPDGRICQCVEEAQV